MISCHQGLDTLRFYKMRVMDKREVLWFFRSSKLILIIHLPQTYWIGCWSAESHSANPPKAFISSFSKYFLSALSLGARLCPELREQRDTVDKSSAVLALPSLPPPNVIAFFHLASSLVHIKENFTWMTITQSKQWEQSYSAGGWVFFKNISVH